ncbi:MAG: bacteriocin [Planctomycetes bacterium]|jgi:uncharacterized linocin/CFP29 family protein|nr:bacteriocin [Planctomycetota bacterium]
MPDILKRDHAPISQRAWGELDAQAGTIFRGCLTGRKVVDFEGPQGWSLAAVNLGKLKVADKKTNGVAWGVREVLPIIELRRPFALKQMEIDNITRGQEDVDLGPLEEAALAMATFEDGAIFNGFQDGKINGMLDASSHKALKLPKDVNDWPEVISKAVKTLTQFGIGGPYQLILGSDEYFDLKHTAKHGYPPKRAIAEMLDTEPLMSQAVSGGMLLSTRGGDFKLTVGKDLSIGYASHDRDNVELFFTETFTFRVVEPAAVIALKKPGN